MMPKGTYRLFLCAARLYACHPANHIAEPFRHHRVQPDSAFAKANHSLQNLMTTSDFMGASHGDFFKYPRTPHLAGSEGTSDDKHLGCRDTERMLTDDSLIVEEKLDGTNVGIHFPNQRLALQCRGHEITAGMHPQYDLFKQWATTKRVTLESMLEERYILYGEWMYARHSILYRALPHYFFEFDIFDKQTQTFLDLATRLNMLDGTGIHTVPVVHQGRINLESLEELIGPSQFDSHFENPTSGRQDNIMEGIYLRTEANGLVTARSKYVRPAFTERVKLSTHWQHQKMIPNQLSDAADIWS